MGKASSTKKARRAAQATHAARRGSLLYPGAIALAVLLGTALVVLSRGEARDRGEGARPRLIASNPDDHWHMAYGVNVCGEYQPDLPEAVNSGIHTHADGLIHQEAQSNAETGARAVLGKFIADHGSKLKVTDTELRLPDGKTYKSGEKCGNDTAKVAAYLWDSPDDDEPTVITKDIAGIRIRDEQVVTIAFVSPGTKPDKPRSVANLDNAGEGDPPPVSPSGPGTSEPPASPPPPTPSP